MSTSSNVSVRQANPEDVNLFLDLVENENWDMSAYDYQAYIKIDPNFMLVAVNKDEYVLGFIGVSKQTPEVVYICGFIVRKEFRGTGVGRILWSAMMEKAGERNLVLDGVKDMVPWYQKQGFQYIYTSVHFYKLILAENMIEPVTSKYKLSELKHETQTWKDILNYDKLVNPNVNREHMLKAWLTGENVFVTVAYDKNDIVGYGSIHRKPNGAYGIRNVFADSEEVLEAILRKLFEPLEVDSVVHFLLFDDKPLPTYLQQSENLNISSKRMFSKSVIEVDKSRIWLYNAHTL